MLALSAGPGGAPGGGLGAPEPGQLRRRGLCGAVAGSLAGFWGNWTLDRIISGVESVFRWQGWAGWVWLSDRYPKKEG